MENVKALLLVYALLVSVNVLITGLLWYSYRAKLYSWLFGLWVVTLLVWLVESVAASQSNLLKVCGFSVSFFGHLIFAYVIAYVVDFKQKAPHLVIIQAIGIALTVMLNQLNASPHLMAFPAVAGCSFPILEASLRALIFYSKRMSFATKGLVWVCLAAGIIDLSYFGAYDDPQKAVIGYTLALVIIFALSAFSAAASIESITRAHADAEAELKFRATLLQSAKLAALGEMAGGVAHEINNPLLIIRGNAEILEDLSVQKPLDPGTVQTRARLIITTVNRIAKIISGLRAFSRDASGDAFQKVSVVSVIEDTLSLCQEKFKESDVKLTFEGSESSLFIQCRPAQISQILLNLLYNAGDAVSRVADKKIALAVEKVRGEVLISVTDSGPPISKEVAEKLFQPFFTTKNVGQGTGLGLSVSTGLAEVHGGSLKYEPNGGLTRFVLRLPAV